MIAHFSHRRAPDRQTRSNGLYLEDAASGKLEFVKSVDIRGNTDEAWRHGLDYMLRHYLFDEP
jgi:hypothetical protein